MKNKLIIAIDGPAGSGKSTVAKEVARQLGLLYVDTGAMYRALTLKAMREKIDLHGREALVKLTKKTKIELKVDDNFTLTVLLDGEDVSEEIRTGPVTDNVKYVARIPDVRKQMVILQRKAASSGKAVRQVLRQTQHPSKHPERSRRTHRSSGSRYSPSLEPSRVASRENRPVLSRGAVLEGRDIGTVVFPGADIKIYLDADMGERVKRRYKELKQKGYNITVDEVRKDVKTRDRTDETRQVAPLKKADDAILIDTTGLTAAEVAERIIKEVKADKK